MSQTTPNNRRSPCCPKRPRRAPPCPGPTVVEVLDQAEQIPVCGTTRATGLESWEIIFSEAVFGVDLCTGAPTCLSCNVRLFLCALNVPAASPCAPNAPSCLTPVPLDSVVQILPSVYQVTFSLAPIPAPPNFEDLQLYVGGVAACPIVNAAGCPLVPFCCNVRFTTEG